jgi:general secretion pathway protein G
MHGPTRSVVLRLLLSAAVGVAMAGVTFGTAFRAMRHASPYQDRHWGAFQTITRLKGVLEEFHQKTGRYPERLADLKDEIPDPWNHPYDYRSDGQSYTLRSFGLDGKPGGPGLARDVDARDVIVEEDGAIKFPRYGYFGGPTFRQYAFDLDTARPVEIACALAGVFAAVACFVTLRNRSRIRLAGMVGNLLLTLLACFVVTLFITALHTPSHH